MRQGTTPKHTFTLPFAVPNTSAVRIIYAQGEKVLFVKTGTDVSIVENKISTRLSQEETFSLDYKQKVKIQIRILTENGEALASHIMTASVEDCLESEVMR